MSILHNRLKSLRKRIAKAPDSPGVYRWLDAKGDVLYVGKAKNLKKRLQQYVQKDAGAAQGPWKRSLMEKAADFDVTIAGSELEALVLETNLIKEMKPKYNVLMKDDKNYVYVRVDTDKPYPPVEVVRRMTDDRAKYFGPFLSAYELNRTLDMLHEIFHFRACRASIDTLNAGKTPARACVESQIGQCNGLCGGTITRDRYRNAVSEVMGFLRGDKDRTLAMLRKEMQEAAAQKKFEKAAKLRDALSAMETMKDTQVISGTDGTDIDAFGVATVGEAGGKSQIVVLRVRNGKLIEERSIALAGQAENIGGILAQFLPQYYDAETDIPDTIVIPESFEDVVVFTEWLSGRQEKSIAVRIPERGRKSKLLEMAQANAQQKITQQFAKWEAAAKNIETALKELKKALKLPAPPKRIEGYDISHLGGVETVGSMVVMKNGKPANAEYRSFTLRTVLEGEIDDYKALREVLRRRLKHCTPEKKNDLTATKLSKKERIALRIQESLHVLKTPKRSREETLLISDKDAPLCIIDIRRSKPKNPMYGTLVATTKTAAKLHACLDILERTLGKNELYLAVQEPFDRDIFSIHGLMSSAKSIPEEFESPAWPVLHRRKTVPDASLLSVPDLLVIDGGKGQLGAVVEVLKELDLKIPVIGLAKREEEIYLPGFSLPVDLPKHSQAQFLLERLRDEAHRSANLHREKRLESRSLASSLDDVPGIGPKTKRELLTKFGSVAGIKEASDDALLTVLTAMQLQSARERL